MTVKVIKLDMKTRGIDEKAMYTLILIESIVYIFFVSIFTIKFFFHR